MDTLKIIIAFLVFSLISLLLKSFNREYGTVFSIAVSVIASVLIVTQIPPLINEITDLTEQAGIKTEYITVMIKALGICYITDFAVDSCNEVGERSMAVKAALCGKIAMTALAIPLIKDVIELSISILEK